MTTVNDVFCYLKTIAPLELQMDFDNAGFLIGHTNSSVTRILVSLDATGKVIDEAIAQHADLIVTHHPIIFHAIKSVKDDTPEGANLLRLIENHIAVISMHTNLDIARGGVNDHLASLFQCSSDRTIGDDCGRICELPQAVPFTDFLKQCKETLKVNTLRYVQGSDFVRHIAFMGGAGAEYIDDVVRAGCDTYVTADVKYHEFLHASEMGLNLIDADHFCTENGITSVLVGKLQEQFPECTVQESRVHQQTVQSY